MGDVDGPGWHTEKAGASQAGHTGLSLGPHRVHCKAQHQGWPLREEKELVARKRGTGDSRALGWRTQHGQRDAGMERLCAWGISGSSGLLRCALRNEKGSQKEDDGALLLLGFIRGKGLVDP